MLQIGMDGEAILASFSGALTIYEVAEYQQQLQQYPLEQEQLVIDLSAVDDIDTAGLQLLMVLRKSLRSRLTMRNHSPSVIELLDVYHLVPFFGDHIILSEH